MLKKNSKNFLVVKKRHNIIYLIILAPMHQATIKKHEMNLTVGLIQQNLVLT
jgi:hypothetical protein